MDLLWPDGVEAPAHLEDLGRSVFLEALRNCEKHADPARIEVRVAAAPPAFELEITNDGTRSGERGSGLGLRLLTVEALQQHALVEFGPLDGGRWYVRLVGALEE
jgi:signal transduction histidine kinase